MNEEERAILYNLQEAKIITSSEKNLRSKIESILRSIENLSAKKARVEFELLKQKRSLVRKREELKRVSKSIKLKSSLVLESTELYHGFDLEEDLNYLRRLDSRLLQESNQVLEDRN